MASFFPHLDVAILAVKLEPSRRPSAPEGISTPPRSYASSDEQAPDGAPRASKQPQRKSQGGSSLVHTQSVLIISLTAFAANRFLSASGMSAPISKIVNTGVMSLDWKHTSHGLHL